MNRLFIGLLLFTFSRSLAAQFIQHLSQGDEYKHALHEDKFRIFCYQGKPKYIIHVWQSVSLLINIKNENYEVYEAATAQLVSNEYIEHRSSWGINLFSYSWKQKQIPLDPFNSSCIGIESKEEYSVKLNVIKIDYWRVLSLIAGIFLFLSAQRLSRNTLFYYICGISFGIGASFLILIYFLSKLFPSKTMMYGVAACGWTIGIYVLQMLWENIRVIVLNYQTQIAWYIFITGLISFVLCYRMGPVSNKRTLNLIQWSLQLMGLILIFFSSRFQEAAMGQIILLIVFHHFPQKWVMKSKALWKTRFPPKVSLLSNDEYYHQGVRETNKALDDLRRYCSSPECNQWRIVSRLNNSKRFAAFIEGESHLSDQEMLEYESSLQDQEFTDDEDGTFTDEDN